MDFPCFISILSNLYTIGPYPFQSDIAVYSITLYSLFRTVLVLFGVQAEKKLYFSSIITTRQAYSILVHYDSRLIISWKES